eukprot:jgi/Chlat1/8029/Chrsp7S07765
MGRSKHKGKHKGAEAIQVKVNLALASELPSDDVDQTTPTSESEEQLTPLLDVSLTPSASHDGPLPAEELAAERSQQLSSNVDATSEVPAPVQDAATDNVSSTAIAADLDSELDAAPSSPPLTDEVHEEPSTVSIEEAAAVVGTDEVPAPDAKAAAALPDEHGNSSSSLPSVAIAGEPAVGLDSDTQEVDAAPSSPPLPIEVHSELSTTAFGEGVHLQDAIATAHDVETAAALPDEAHDEPSTTAAGGGVNLQHATSHDGDTAAVLLDVVHAKPSGIAAAESVDSQEAAAHDGETSALPDEVYDEPSTSATGEGVGSQDAVTHVGETAAALPDERDNTVNSPPPMAIYEERSASQSAPVPLEGVGAVASTSATGEGMSLQDVVAAGHDVEIAVVLADERDKEESTPPPPVASEANLMASQSAPVPSPVSLLEPESAGDSAVWAKHNGSTSLFPALAQADVHSNSLLPTDGMEPALPAAHAVESNNVKQLDGLMSASPAIVQADVHNNSSVLDSMEPVLPPAPAVESNVAIAAQLPETSVQTLSVAAVPARQNTSGSGHISSPTQAVKDDIDRRLQAAEVASLRQAKQELETKLIKLQKGLRNRMKELANEKQDMQLQLDTASQRAAELEAQLHEQRALAEQQAAAHADSAARLQMQIGRLAEELANSHSELELRERALTESRRMASAKEQSVLDLQHTLEQLNLQHKDTQAQEEEKFAQLTAQLAQSQADLQHNRDELVQARAHTDSRIVELETQLAAAAADAETASAKAAEEAATLEAALEVVKADLNRRTREQDGERERVKVAMVEMRKKVERAEAARRKAVASADGVKEVLENELQQSNTARNILEEELAAAKDQLVRLQEELRSYKQRAQMLLKRKDEELLASATAKRNQAAEQALHETQQALQEILAERDASVRAISEMAQQHQDELATYEEAAIAREQRIADLQQQFDLASMEVVRVADEWRTRCETVERTWRERCEAMQAQIASLERSSKVAARTRSELESLRKERDRLKEEFNSFRDIASSMVEAKDTEIAKLLDDMAALRVRHVRQQSDAASHLSDDTHTPLSRASMSWSSMTEKVNGRTERFHDPVSEDLAYQLHLQDKRDEQLAFAERKVMELQEELVEAQQEIELHTAQETALKEAIRELERSKRREGVDMTYLKNIVLKLILSGEVETLLPVVGSLLQFTPDEIKRCKDVYDTRQAVPLSAAVSVVDAMAQPTHSLFTSLAATFGSRT